jgi:hypothetical protein
MRTTWIFWLGIAAADLIGIGALLVGLHNESWSLIAFGAVLLAVTPVALVFNITTAQEREARAALRSLDKGGVLYADTLVTITERGITFHRYYFPSYSSKYVAWPEFEEVAVEKPTIWTGKWRIHGTGDFRTWFPSDAQRPKRDVLFLAKLNTQWTRIGFTVENADQVIAILKEKGVLKSV